jgi:hypothetical protein
MTGENNNENSSALSDMLRAIGFSTKAKKEAAGTPSEPQESGKTIREFENPVSGEEERQAFSVKKNKKTLKIVTGGIFFLLSAYGLYYLWPFLMEETPPGEDVVASFNNRNISVSDLKDFIALESGGREAPEIDTVEGYGRVLRMMALEQIIQEWAAKRGIDQREDVQHTLKDLLDDSSIDQLIHQIQQKELSAESIPKYEVQEYYDNNREQYGERNFSDVEHEIRDILVSEKEKDFFPKYIDELKKTVGLEVNFELLKLPEKEYTLRRDEALFSVHGRRYTIGDYYTEFNELPGDYQKAFATYESKRQLLEQFIAKELLLEEVGDATASRSEQHNREELKIQYLSQILHQEEVENRITEPTEEEIQRYYNEKADYLIMPERVKINLIWISEGQNGETRQQALQKANDALSLMREGRDFAEVAKAYSEDYSAPAGGEINQWITRDILPPDLGDKIFSLAAGEISGIIESDNRIFIIKVNEKIEQEPIPYDDAKDTIIRHLQEIQHEKLQNQMQEKIFKDSGFTVYNKTLRKLIKGEL